MSDRSNTEAWIPPQDHDMEQIVLGTMMLSKQAHVEGLELLVSETFYYPKHKFIYDAIKVLSEQDKPIDIMTVSDQLRKSEKLQEVGGPAYISSLTIRVGSEMHFEHHCLILKEHYIKREQIEFGGALARRSMDPKEDVFKTNEYMSDMVHQIQNIGELKTIETNGDLILQIKEDIENAAKMQGVTGVPSGFKEQDRLFGGFQAPDLRILAARPGMGKTALMLCEAFNEVVDHGKTVMIFSLEMSSKQLLKRMVSLASQIDATKFKTGAMSYEDWTKFHDRINVLITDKLIIVDNCTTVQEIRNRAKKERIKHDIDKLYVDYLQIMEGKGQSREQEISHISRSLKKLCKEISCPITALSQLSRKVDERGDKRPKLSDLRESGAIEQDADIVQFLYRPQYYNEGQPGLAYAIVAKHRNGELKDIKLRYIHARTQFIDWTEEEHETEVEEQTEDKPF